MGAMVSEITSLTIVYSTVYSSADQRKHQSSASLAFVWGIHRRPMNSPHKWPVTRKLFPFDDVIMVRFWRDERLLSRQGMYSHAYKWHKHFAAYYIYSMRVFVLFSGYKYVLKFVFIYELTRENSIRFMFCPCIAHLFTNNVVLFRKSALLNSILSHNLKVTSTAKLRDHVTYLYHDRSNV